MDSTSMKDILAAELGQFRVSCLQQFSIVTKSFVLTHSENRIFPVVSWCVGIGRFYCNKCTSSCKCTISVH